MSDTKPFLTLDIRCCCGGSLFVEVPQEEHKFHGLDLPKAVVQLGVSWSNAHAAHHQEPKKP